MIKLENYTPEIYYKQSRDFQYLGRLFDVVLNSVKTNTDMIYDIPSSDAAGSKMIELLALTLGFKATHTYNIKQLAAICSILPVILRNKGSQYAIEMACQAALTAEGIIAQTKVAVYEENITLYIPQALSDINLITDLLDYILPAGITCEIIRTASRDLHEAENIFSFSSDVYRPGTNDWNNNQAQLEEDTKSTINTATAAAAIAEQIMDNDSMTQTNDRDYPGLMTNSTVVRPRNISLANENTNDNEGD